MSDANEDKPGQRTQRILGSLRDALAAASKEDVTKAPPPVPAVVPVASLPPPPSDKDTAAMSDNPKSPSAAEAAREARGGTPNIPPVERHVEFEQPPTTRVVREAVPEPDDDRPARTQLVRGRQQVARGTFDQDPVVGWLVIVGGPGIGSYRPIFEGNNSVGRASNQRIPIDFGDDAISSEEQAFVRYDSADRSFLFVPNLAKTNVVSLNDKRPTSAVALTAMDVIQMGRTQLVFVPFCGTEFDWSELTDTKE